MALVNFGDPQGRAPGNLALGIAGGAIANAAYNAASNAFGNLLEQNRSIHHGDLQEWQEALSSEQRAEEKREGKRKRSDDERPGSGGSTSGSTSGLPGSQVPMWKKTWKSYGTQVALSAYNDSASSTILNAMAQNLDENGRIGRVVHNKHILVKFLVKLWFDSAWEFQARAYAVLGYDKQFNGSATGPTTANLFDTVNYATSEALMIPLNLNNRDRFVILKKWNWVCGQTTASYSGGSNTGGENPKYIFEEWGTYLNFDTIYNNTTGVNQSIQTGALFLYFWSNHSSAVGTPAGLTCTYRLRYTD